IDVEELLVRERMNFAGQLASASFVFEAVDVAPGAAQGIQPLDKIDGQKLRRIGIRALAITQHLQRASIRIERFSFARNAQYRVRIALGEKRELPAFARLADVGAQ